MPTIKQPVAGITSPVPGAFCYTKMTVGPRYHWAKYKIGIPADVANPVTVEQLIGEIKININGAAVREVDATILRNLARFNNLTVADDEIPIYFVEPWQETPQQMYRGAWPTPAALVRSFEIQMFVRAGVLTPAQAAGLTITAYEAHDWNIPYRINGVDNWIGSPSIPEGGSFLQSIMHQTTFTQPISAGVYNFTTLPLNQPINRLFLQKQDGSAINRVEVLADDVSYFDVDAETNALALADLNMSASVWTFPIPFDEYGTADAIIGRRSLNVRIHSPTAGAVTILNESLQGSY
ncbi:hypothetical protein [Geminisphaera colitermitum]|uniref:hypothetical protein n=1 Tax=Geminisphaera colitermitum TaxID=1148786 RepID=UPI000158C97D|nr:hypothetical protein [Geminisphaera colitermitum]